LVRWPGVSSSLVCKKMWPPSTTAAATTIPMISGSFDLGASMSGVGSGVLEDTGGYLF
jgi:hypothetical protein